MPKNDSITVTCPTVGDLVFSAPKSGSQHLKLNHNTHFPGDHRRRPLYHILLHTVGTKQDPYNSIGEGERQRRDTIVAPQRRSQDGEAQQ